MALLNRRTFFLSSAGFGLAAAPPRLRAKSLNERLNVGFIGLGGRGNEQLAAFERISEVRIAALCDPDAHALHRASEKYPGAAAFADLRKLLEDRNVDAVVIATCNHWHALAAIWACQHGKDVYVEKPLAHNHWEGRQLVRAAKTYDRIVQVGTQQRSDPLQAELKDFLHSKQALGGVKFVQVGRFDERKSIGKRSTPLRPPAELDYNLWLGPAQDQPIYRDKLHYDWHWDWNTGNGEMGNWGVHVLDDVLNVVLLDREPYPKQLVAGGGRVLWNDAGQTPNVCFAYYGTGTIPILFGLSNLAQLRNDAPRFDGVATGYVVHCENGYYAGVRGGGAAHDLSGRVIRRFTGDSGAAHQQNFVNAVFARKRELLNAEVNIGHHSTAWCNLTNIALRLGETYSHERAESLGEPADSWRAVVDLMEHHLATNSVDIATELRLSPILQFDPNTQEFTGNHAAAANRLLHREYRESFRISSLE